MTDPARLFEGEATPFERELLGAAANERLAPELVSSLEQALGIGAAGAKAAAGAGLSASGYMALAALALGGAGIGWVALAEPAAAPAPAALVRAAPGAAVTEVKAVAPPPALEAAPEPAAMPEEPAPKRVLTGRKAAPGDELRAEIRLVDEARAALRSGAAERARGLLEKYAQRYPNGSFRQEAAVLRVEALERSGQRAKASTLARKFLEEHPDSPHVERVGRALE